MPPDGDPESDHGRFRVGDRVRVLVEQPFGNPRVPRYVRGNAGSVIAVHGRLANPLDHRLVYPPLYTVLFDLADISGVCRDQVAVDLHEEWLEDPS